MFLTARSRVKRQTGQYWITRIQDEEQLRKILKKVYLRELCLAGYEISEEILVQLRFKKQQATLRKEELEFRNNPILQNRQKTGDECVD